ncbi:sensor histidine kinase [Boudabousia marimammalium]|uniref:histidine kinase n=1 Tax=Boudabousia marimammalium TaxID=156892 RepID=A0A1Q5PM87_9ACTO|nr:sensor histidine kinase [Boudabousia marimammalium]OKL48122.1 hypothetical protein BM477_06130 [Boudabousia marimammalium]
MQKFREIITKNASPELSNQQIDWLQVLVSDWQILADLSPADLVLWIPTSDNRFIAVAHCRPATAVTVHLDDIVGLYTSSSKASFLNEARRSMKVISPQAPRWAGSYSVQETAVPVVRNGVCIAVMSAETNLGASTSTSNMDAWLSNSAQIFMKMIANGEYPYRATPTSAFNGAPRVVDGVVRLDEDGIVLGISPNARSCFRRLGVKSQIVHENLVKLVADCTVQGLSVVDESLPLVLMGRAAWRTEVEAGGTTLSIRALPLTRRGGRQGAIVLVRDVSEMRQIEREIMSKEATIREIHHRVKNNLATVSALIRMQLRRSNNPEVKVALGEADRRVATIATVHEALSHSLEGTIAYTPLARTVIANAALLASSANQVVTKVEGDFGLIDADRASTLSTVLAELVANSVEHGYQDNDGTIEVYVEREGQYAHIRLVDHGVGIAEGRTGTGLGTQIVASLVEAELHGSITWRKRAEGGTEVLLHVQVQQGEN